MKKFAVFDIDGTLVRWQLYHAVVDNLVKRGVISGERFETIRGARRAWKRHAPGASFKSYETEIIVAYEEGLAQISKNQLLESMNEVFEEYRDQVYIFTRQLIKDLKEQGYLLFAISGSQTEIVHLIAEHYGFNDYVGTEYEWINDHFSGKKSFHAAKKDKVLKRLVDKHQVSFKDSFGIGDSKSDAAMLKLVDNPIAFNPDQDLYKIAADNKWKIVLERKNMVYELEKTNGKYQLAKTNIS